MKEQLQAELDWVQPPDATADLLQLARDRQERLGGKVIARLHHNEFTRNVKVVEDTDYYFSDITVDSDYRRQGIGAELIRRRIALAREDHASAIYAHCWQGGNVSRLHRRFGFHPLYTFGPAYPDGNAVKVIGKQLVRPSARTKK